jgi:hypothetical protein
MCVVSMIGDHYRDKWEPWVSPMNPNNPWTIYPANPLPTELPISRQEFDELKREVAEMVALLKRAKKYDEDNGEPNCELDEKMAILRKVAELVGVDLDEVLKGGK